MLDKETVQSFEKHADEIFSDNIVPGLAYGLAKNSELIYGKGYGKRDVTNDLGVDMDTVFCIGSLTKSFTAVAILQLQEAGKLSVHNPIIEFLPEFRLKNTDAYKQMTIHHFLTHTTGIPPVPFMANSLVNAINKDFTKEEAILEVMTDDKEPENYVELMDLIAEQDVELLDIPGTVFSYCNECFCLLGAVIERASGMSYEDYVQENILKPAKLTNTGFFDENFSANENITKLYIQRNNKGKVDLYESTKWWDAPAMRATGLLRSTVNDYVRYSEIFTSGGVIGGERILSDASVKQILTPYVKTHVIPNQYYGYGLKLTNLSDDITLIEHDGNGKGVTAYMQIIPEKQLTAVGLANMQKAPSIGIVSSLINIGLGYAPDYSRVSEQTIDLTNERLAEYVGSYDSGDRGPATVTTENGRLTITSYGATYLLEYIGDDQFKIVSESTDEIVTFFRKDVGNIYRLSFSGRLHTKK